MVKVRGQRIEIPEVERHVSSVDGVKLGLVCVPTKGKCNGRLVAVIMLEEPPCAVEEFVPSGRLTFAPGTFTSDTVQRFQKALLAKLPEYMIPTSWVVVQTIPLTATGKLDRVSTTAWLQEIDSEICEKIFRSTTAGEIEQPIGDTECRLQQIWAQVLNLNPEAIGRNESFLNLGGDSTSAMTVISQCRKNGIVITVRDVIRSNCIADLARVATLLDLPQEEVISTDIETRVDVAPTTTGEDPPQPAKNDPNIAQVLSCSPMQESLLLSQSKANGQGKYECSFTFKLVSEDGIEPANIVNAWQRVMNRHSALRTFFRESRERPGTFEQVVLHQIEANTTIFNLRKMPIEVATFLEGHQTIHSEGKPPHGLTICQKTDKEAFLKLDISHLIFDGFSIAIMMGDLHAAVCGTLSTDYAPSYGQYVDFLQQQNTAQSLEYWRLFLSDLEPCSIPTLRIPAPPKTDGQNLAQLRRVFPHYTHLRKFAMAQATTPSSVIQLAWGLVLRSLLNRDDVAFGVMTSGRETPIEGIEKIVGPVINSIICRCDLNQERTVKSVLDQLQDEFLDALAHQYVHPGHVQRVAGQKQAIFSTALSVLKSADLTCSEKGIKLTSEKQYQPTEFDISLLILLGDESMTIELTFWDGKMTQNQANAIFDTFIQAISAIINIFDAEIAQIGSITLLSEDCHMMVGQRARESYIESAESVITELIQETVLRQPDALAISSWDGDLTYQEVDELSSILSLTLLKQHPYLSKGDFVCLYFEKSRWAVVSMMAVLKAGCAFIPLDPKHPRARLQSIVTQSNAKLIIATETTQHACLDMGPTLHCLQPGSLSDTAPEQGLVLPHITPDDDAYVFFTSGSTGQPKGVVIQQRALCSGIENHWPKMNYTKETRVLQHCSYTFDISIADIFTTLRVGGCICIPSDHQRMEDLVGAIKLLRANWAVFTPSELRIIQPEQVPTLKTIIVGGEPVAADLIAIWADKVKLIISYGPTECTIWTSRYEVGGQNLDHTNIGRAMGCSTYVVEAANHNKLVPIEGVGELLVTGPILSRGYLNNAEATRLAFVTDLEWAKEKDARFYKTGDLVRLNSDGTVSFIGRKDTQVKLRGQRVELTEIEIALASTAAVILPKVGPFQDRLVAVVSLLQKLAEPQGSHNIRVMNITHTKEAEDLIDDLRASASRVLAPYMVPTDWVVLKQLPSLASGKLDRKFLREWLETMDASKHSELIGVEESSWRPSNDQEEVLLQTVAEILNKSAGTVNFKSSFIASGGDSISAMQLTSRCASKGYRLMVRHVLQTSSLLALASKMVRTTKTPQVEQYEEIIDKQFKLNPIQKMHFQSIPSGTNHFNQSYLLKLTGQFSDTTLEHALRDIAKAHGMLRSRFIRHKDEWLQLVSSSTDNCLDFRAVSAGSFESVCDIATARHKDIDITSGPLFIVTSISAPEGKFLSMICHHLAIDLYSWRIIINDLQELLLGRTLQPASTPFSTWTYLQERHIRGERMIEIPDRMVDLDFWGMKNEDNLFADTEEVMAALSPNVTSEMLRLASDTLNCEVADMLLASIYSSFAQEFPDHPPPSIFSEQHGRDVWDSSIDISRTVGWFTTMAPLSAAIAKDTSPLEALKLARISRKLQTVAGAKEFNHRYLHEHWSNAPKSSGIEILYNFFGRNDQFDTAESIFTPVLYKESVTANYDSSLPRPALMEINAQLQGGELKMHMSYNNKMKFAEKIASFPRQMMKNLTKLIDAIPHNSGVWTVADVPLANLEQAQLDKTTSHLARAGIDLGNIEDIYPATPTQEGILVSQQKAPAQYISRMITKLSLESGKNFDTSRFADAYSQVICRHPMLRTLFVESNGDHLYDQVVLKHWTPVFETLSPSNEDPVDQLRSWHSHKFNSLISPHAIGLREVGEELYVCVVINHAINDAHSYSMIMGELLSIFNGEQIPEVHGKYSDYVSFLQQLDTREAMSFWKEYLEDAVPCQFPVMQVAPQDQEEHRTIIVDMSGNVSEFKGFCSKNETTLSNLFQVAWGLVIGQYVGTDEVCFGSLTSGRDIELGTNPHGICGPLINTLVTRISFNRQKTIRDLLRNTSQDYTDALSHQHVPLMQIQHDLSLSGSSLFNTSMSLTREALSGDLPGTIRKERVYFYDPTEYVCSLNVEVGSESLGFAVNYLNTAIPSQVAGFIADSVKSLLVDIVANPDMLVSDLRLAGPSSLQQISAWNSVPSPKVHRCVHHIVEEMVREQPNHPAVCSWDLDLTYAQLNDLSDRLALQLRQNGVEPEVFVPLCFEKSGWHVVTMLAIIKAGGVCVALDPSHPHSRLVEIVKDVKAHIILASATYADRFADVVEKVIVVSHKTLEDLKTVHFDESILSRPSPVQPHNAAFVVFTSGSTGKPKGIVLEHDAVASSAKTHGEAMMVGKDSRVIQFAAYMFDVSIEDLFTTLMRGGTVCVPSESERMNDLAGALKKYRANWACLTPTVASMLTPEDVSDMSFIALGGERVRKETVETLADHTFLSLIYGPAECCMTMSCNVGVANNANPANLGHQVGAFMWLVDPNDHNVLVPVGAVGEILIEGPLLARHYLHEPEKTAASFIKDPAFVKGGGQPGRRMYLSGDLGRYNYDGSVSFVRRKDNQVKVRGNRIELGEIEFNLWNHPSVRHGLAYMPDTGVLSGKIVTVLSLRALDPPTTEYSTIRVIDRNLQKQFNTELQKIKDTLANQLPSYMIPSVWLIVHRVPLNTSGKMDRMKVKNWVNSIEEEEALTDMIEDEQVSGDEPSTDLEISLMEIWERVLGNPRVSASRSFISLGGDSLTAMQVVSQSRRIGIQVTVQDVLRCHNVVELASNATLLTLAANVAEETLNVEFNLTPIQHSYFAMNSSGKSRNNQSCLVRISKPTNEEHIRSAVHTIVERHSMLRARFIKSNVTEEWHQKITSDTAGSYWFSRRKTHSGSETRALIRDLAEAANFDVTNGPLFCFHVIEQDQEQFAFMAASHLIVDIVSWNIITRDLEDILTGHQLSGSPLSFQIWANMQEEQSVDKHDPASVLVQEVPTPNYAYWGIKPTENLIADVVAASFTLDKQTSLALHGHSNRSFHTDPVELMMAAISHAFSQTFSDRLPASIFYESHGREAWDTAIDLTSTVGWFTTIAPIHVGATSNIFDTIVRVKDVKRFTPQGGRPFFCSQYLHKQDQKEFETLRQPEILFNYVGMQHQDQAGRAALQRLGPSDLATESLNHSSDVVRTALFDVLVSSEPEAVAYHFLYNKNMRHQDRIRTWISTCQIVLQDMTLALAMQEPQLTMVDIPFASLDWKHLEHVRSALRAKGIHESNVNEVYPLSSAQLGMLLSQQKRNGSYTFYSIIEVEVTTALEQVQPEKLLSAWDQVVQRHSILRTIFLDVTTIDGKYQQVTLGEIEPITSVIHCANSEEAVSSLEANENVAFAENCPPHCLTVCSTNQGKVFFRFDMDHKIVDGFSIGLLMKDLLFFYNHGSHGSQLGTSPQYREYVELVESKPRTKMIQHWKGYLEDAERTFFPTLTDRKREDIVGQHNASVYLGLPANEVHAFCRKHNMTLFSLLQTSWALVLKTFTGLDKVCFGYLSAGREAPINGIESIVGPTINMMICHLDLTSEKLTSDVLGKCQSDFLGNIEHQFVSLADIHHALGISGDALFNTILSLQRSKDDEAVDGSIRLTRVSGTDPTEYMITVDITASETAIDIEIASQKFAITSGATKNIASTFAQAIRSVMKGFSTPIGDLDLVSPENLSDIAKWNGNEIDLVDARIESIIDTRAAGQGDKEAVVGWDGRFSYSELINASNRIAKQLMTLGVKPETIVPFCFEKSTWTIVAMLGILKAGGACAALDPAFPIERLKSIVGATGASPIVCSEGTKALARCLASEILIVSPQQLETMPSASDLLPVGGPNNAAFVQFTSGSTGTPKGIIIEHRSMATSSRAHGTAMSMGTHTRAFQFASYTYDVSVEEIFTTLQFGGTVCVPSEEERINDINHAIGRYQATWADLTPTVLALINPDLVPSLTTICLGGEPARQDVVDVWAGKVRLLNGYGPAEASVACTCSTEDLKGLAAANIGVGVGCKLWVVDPADYNRLAPIGTIGELLIEGPVLARGYLKDEEKTNLGFIRNPTWAQRPMRAYRTHDLVRYTSDGSLVFVGRADSQVKIRGQRVELNDIESNLLSCPDVHSAAILFPHTGPCANQLVGVITLPREQRNDEHLPPLTRISDDDASSAISKAIQWLTDRLPTHMVPHTWAVVNAIPLMPSGKLDKKITNGWVASMSDEVYEELKGLGHSVTHDTASVMMSETERQVQILCGEVLNKPPGQIPLDRSFMNLGGDSISAMRLTSHARDADWEMSVQSILRSKTLHEVALEAKPMKAVRHIPDTEVIGEPFGLSPIQNWFFRLFPHGENHYNQSFALRVRREIDFPKLEFAIHALVSRHSMLRARFSRSDNGVWTQKIIADIVGSFKIAAHSLVDISELGKVAQSLEKSINIQQGPLLQVALCNVAGEEPILLMIGHHLVVDLVSWRILLDDLEYLLVKGSIPRASQVSFQKWSSYRDSRVGPADKTSSIVSNLTRHNDNSDIHYWNLDLRQHTYSNMSMKSFSLSEELTAMLLSSSNEPLSTEPMDIFLSALVLSFGKAFPDRSIPPIFHEHHGRETITSDINVSDTVGWFTVLKPFITAFDTSSDVIQSLVRAKDFRRTNELNSVADFEATYEHVLKHHPVLEVLFNFVGQFQQLDREESLFKTFNGKRQWTDIDTTSRCDTIFDIEASVVENKLKVRFLFSNLTAHQDKIDDWIASYKESLSETVTRLQTQSFMCTLSDFPRLAMTHECFNTLLTKSLPSLHITELSDVEDIYPCSPIQEGMLLSQGKSAEFYKFHLVCKLSAKNNGPVSAKRLRSAWETVVRRHTTLRTVLLHDPEIGSGFYQIVLRNPTPAFEVLDCDGGNAQFPDPKISSAVEDRASLPHHLRICQSAEGNVVIQLEMNHALTDGASTAILLKDLVTAYEGNLSIEGPKFSNYIGFLQSSDREASLAFWHDYLQDASPTLLSFPTLQNASRSLECQAIDCQMDMAELKRLCSRNDITIANILQLSWALVLRTYTGSDDVCYGNLTYGRDAPVKGVADMVGPLINMLPARLSVGPEVNVLNALGALQKSFIASLSHQNVSLAEMQHVVHDKLQGSALFNTIVSIQRKQSSDDSSQNSLAIEVLGGNDPTEYDVCLGVEISDTGIHVTLNYWTDKISTNQASFVGSTFVQLLHGITSTPNKAIGHIKTIPSTHEEQIHDWNSSQLTANETCIHTNFERQVREIPDSPALFTAQRSYSYCELNTAAQKLAKYLIDEFGIGPESLVPLSFEKSEWMVISQAAVLKAGAANVFVDPAHPTARKRDMLQDVGADFVIASPTTAPLFQDWTRVLVVDDDLLEGLVASDEALCHSVRSHNTAFVVFTSGSTGRPKGVMLTHRNVSTSSTAHGDALQLGRGSRVLQFSSYNFDISIQDHWTTLTRGGCICIPTEEERMNDISGAIQRMKVNWMALTSTVASLIDPSDVPSVKSVVLTGEVASSSNIQKWADKVKLNVCYGPAEATIYCSWKGDIGKNDYASDIGRPIASKIWVTHPEDVKSLVPIGCVGEACIEGPLLANGYLNDQDKTDHSFIYSPAFTNTTGHDSSLRFYRTGDLVRYNDNGSLIYVGRKNNQVKINGQRIELEEVEHHLQSCDSVGQAVTLVPSAGRVQNRLVAVISPDRFIHSGKATTSLQQLDMDQLKSSQCEASSLRNQLNTFLPRHMIPAVWFFVNRLPVGPTGKLSRKAVESWILQMTDDEYNSAIAQASPLTITGPATPRERIIQRVISSILKIPISQVSLTSSFVSLGGDSIFAMHVITRCREEGLICDVINILKSSSLQEVAAQSTSIGEQGSALETEESTDNWQPLNEEEYNQVLEKAATASGLENPIIESVTRCTPMQTGMLISQQKNGSHYNIDLAWEMSFATGLGQITLKVVQDAWLSVVRRHAILRSVFIPSFHPDELYDQVFLRDVLPTIQHHSSGLTIQLPLHTFTATIASSRSPKIACRLQISHAIVDGSSFDILLENLAAYMTGSQLNTDALQFDRYANHVPRAPAQDSMNFWKGYLADVSPCYLKIDQQSVASFPTDRVNRKEIEISDELSQATLSFCKRKSITVATFMQAVWSLVLQAYTGADSVCFGVMSSCRDVPLRGIEEAVGPYLNMLVSRTTFETDTTITTLLNAIQRHYVDAREHQDVPLASIQHSMGLKGQALYNTVMSIQRSHSRHSETMHGISFEPVSNDGPTEYSCTVSVAMYDLDRISADIAYWTTEIHDEAASSIAATFTTIMANFIMSPDANISSLSRCSTRDTAAIASWNAQEVQAIQSLMHETFMRQVRENPLKDSIVTSNMVLTYQQLDDLSTRLALYLHSRGIRPQDRVPFCLEKSPLAIICMLGILKAGGAFVPLDPSHPTNRINSIVESTGARLVLTSPSTTEHIKIGVAEALTIDLDFVSSLPATPSINLEPNVQPEDVAVVMYTSGSTGVPKGVVLSHKALCTSIEQHTKFLGMTGKTRTLQFSAFVFDACIHDIFMTLSAGGCVCVPTEAERMNDLGAAMERMKVNWACLTTTVASTLASMSPTPSLETLILAGESITTEAVEYWTLRMKKLGNMYGPCESSVFAVGTAHINPRDSISKLGQVTCGHAWIVDPDDHTKLMPIGSVGELLIQGPSLARCYLDDSQKTANSFIPAPSFCTSRDGDYSRCYKTGDLARFSWDGSIYYLGRKDAQVKINGQRVELGEIEHHLNTGLGEKFEGIVEQINVGTLRVIAAFVWQVTARAGGEPAIYPGLESFEAVVKNAMYRLERSVMSYMRPKAFIPVSAIPTTTSGKIDRQALRSLASSSITPSTLSRYRPTPAASKALKRSGVSIETLRGMFSSALRINGFDIDNDSHFFELGGDSISAIKLAALARKNGLDMTVADIFQCPILSDLSGLVQKRLKHKDTAINLSEAAPGTVAQLDRAISATKDARAASASQTSTGLIARPTNFDEDATLFNHVSPFSFQNTVMGLHHFRSAAMAQIESVYPTTGYQEWALSCGLMRSRGYNNYFLVEFESDINVQALKVACQRLVDTYPILRTLFTLQKDKGVQVVLRPLPIDFQLFDTERNQGIENPVEHYIQRDMSEPVHMGQMITRFLFIQGPSHKSTLAIRLSHAQYDGFTLPKLLEALAAAYEGQQPSPPTSYLNFVNYTESLSKAELTSFWESYLANSRMTELVLHRSPSVDNVLNQSVISHIPQPSLPSGVTFSTALKVCWGLTLSKITSSRDVVFGFVTSGRSAAVHEIESVAGPCASIIPARIKTCTESMMTLLQHEQAQAISCLPYEAIALHQLVDKCTSWRKWTRFNSVVQHQNLDLVSDSSLRFGTHECKIGFHLPPNDAADVWVWSLPQSDGSLKVELTYSDRTISSHTAGQVLDVLCHFISLVKPDCDETPVLPAGMAVPSLPAGKHAPNPSASLSPSARSLQAVASSWNAVLGESARRFDIGKASTTPGTNTTYSDGALSSSPSVPTPNSSNSSVCSEKKGIRILEETAKKLKWQTAALLEDSWEAGLSTPQDSDGNTELGLKAALEMLGCYFSLDEAFYDVSSSPLIAAQLASAYQSFGYSFDAQDIMVQPTIREHLNMLNAL